MLATVGHIQWGDVATWVGGSATAIALLLTYGLLRVTRQEQRSIRAEKVEEQARRFNAWCAAVYPGDPSPDRVEVEISNPSEQPVFAVRVAVGADWWSKPIPYVEIKNVPFVLPPGYRGIHAVEMKLGRINGKPDESPPVEVLFSDALHGRYWWRDRYGGLTEIRPGEGIPPSGPMWFMKPPANLIEGARRPLLVRLARRVVRRGT